MGGQELHTGVVIIGAGPAGAATSIFLSRSGIQHIVLEKDRFPRDKVCGDACSGRTTQVINKADPNWLAEMRTAPETFHPTWGMTVVAPNERRIDIPYVADRTKQDMAKGFTVPRLIFDDFLFQKLPSEQAIIHQDTEILSIEYQSGFHIVKCKSEKGITTIKSPIIVGADGDKSLVRKYLIPSGGVVKPAAVGLRLYYDGVTGMHENNHIELHYLDSLPFGYLWIFPLSGGRANIGVGMLAETVKKKRINLRSVFHKALQDHPRFKARFADAVILGKTEGWGIPIYTGRQSICGDGYLLTGDAAQLVDPFSGEGIGNALYSGMMAAEAIEASLKENDISAEFFKSRYELPLYRALGPELDQNAAMQRIFLNRHVFNWFFDKAFKSETLRNAISHMFTDAEMYKKFRDPIFYLKVLMNR